MLRTACSLFHMEHSEALAEQTASRIAEAIKANGTSIVWLCSKTGIPRTTMNRSLRRQRAFNLNEVARIAEALRVPAADLLAIPAGAAA